MEYALKANLLCQIQFVVLLVSIISIFSPITIYYGFFLLFIFLQIILQIYSGKIQASSVNFGAITYGFLIVATVSFLINYELSDEIQFIKLWINLNFLLAGICYVRENYKFINFKAIKYLLEAIIVLSFIQILLNVSIMGLFRLPFEGVENSVIAYNIVIPPIYFGIEEKNIWATKIAFIQIIYIGLLRLNIIKTFKYKYYLLLFLMLFNIVYTFSRTAQLAFLFCIMYFFYFGIRNRLSQLAKWGWNLVFVFIFVCLSTLIYDKLFHVTLESGDGMLGRLELWMALYNNLDKMNWIWGNGVLYGQYLISTKTHWTNNNFHNVILNMFADFGLLGLFSYLSIIYKVFCDINMKEIKHIKLWGFFVPFFIVINSQYLGYDNDIVVYLILIYLILLRTRLPLKNDITIN